MNQDQPLPPVAEQFLQHIVTQGVHFAETNFKGTSEQDKKGIVYQGVKAILDRLYDQADASLDCPEFVDAVAKEALIPFLSNMIEDAVKRFKLFGWELSLNE
jgi:hypothetical protein